MAIVQFTQDAIDAEAAAALVSAPEFGAVVTFLGSVRGSVGPEKVVRLEYDAYRPLADHRAAEIAAEAEERWPVRCAIVHRLGPVNVGDGSVVIAVASPHRADAFEACRWLLDELKATVPIWKKEFTESGACWVEGAERVPSGERPAGDHR
jgi:molybdopterin synthase catalytic subunit